MPPAFCLNLKHRLKDGAGVSIVRRCGRDITVNLNLRHFENPPQRRKGAEKNAEKQRQETRKGSLSYLCSSRNQMISPLLLFCAFPASSAPLRWVFRI